MKEEGLCGPVDAAFANTIPNCVRENNSEKETNKTVIKIAQKERSQEVRN